MPERLNGLDSKSSERGKTCSVGSNPTLSARVFGALFLAATLVLASAWWAGPARAQAEAFRLGAGRSTVQIVLGQLTKQLLEQSGLRIETAFGLDPEVLHAALAAGRLDLYWEYTGQALVVYQRNPDRAVLIDPQACYRAVKEYDAAKGLVWGRAAPANLTYGLVMKKERAEELGVATSADLAALTPKPEEPEEAVEPAGKKEKKADKKSEQKPTKKAADKTVPKKAESDVTTSELKIKLKLGLEPEFLNRPDGYKAFAKRFDFHFPPAQLVKLDPALIFKALDKGKIDAAVAPVVDSRITLYELTVIPLDQPFFPAYNPAPVWTQAARRKAGPELTERIDRLAAALDAATLNKLVYLVEVEHVSPAEAAQSWIAQSGL